MNKLESLEKFEVFLKYLSIENTSRLKKALLNFQFLKLKTEIKGANSLVSDFDYLSDDKDVQNVQQAVRLSSQIIKNDQIQLASQLIGHLKNYENSSKPIRYLLKSISITEPWLRPRFGTLEKTTKPLKHSITTNLQRVHYPQGAEIAMLNNRVSELFHLPDNNIILSKFKNTQLTILDTEKRELKDSFQIASWTNFSAFFLIPDTNTLLISLYSKTDNEEARSTLAFFDIYEKKLKTIGLIQGQVSAINYMSSNDLVIVSSGYRIIGYTLSDCTEQIELYEEENLANGFIKRIILGENEGEFYTQSKSYLKKWKIGEDKSIFELEIASMRDIGGKSLWHDSRNVVFNPSFDRVVFSNDKELVVFDLIERKKLISSKEFVGDPFFFVDEKHIFITKGNALIYFDIENFEEVTSLPLPANVEFTYVKNNEIITLISTGSVLVFDIPLFIEYKEQLEHKNAISKLEFNPYSCTLFSVGDDYLIIEWDVSTNSTLRNLEYHRDKIRQFIFNPDCTKAISVSDDTEAVLWNLEKPPHTPFNLKRKGYTAKFSVNNKLLVISAENNIGVVQTTKRKYLNYGYSTYRSPLHEYDLCILPNGQEILITNIYPYIELYSLYTSFKPKRFEIQGDNDNDRFKKIELLPNGHELLVGFQHRVKLLNLQNGNIKEINRPLTSIENFFISPKGDKLILESEGRLKLYDLKNYQCIFDYTDSSEHLILSISFNGEFFVSAKKNILKLWSVSEKKYLARFSNETNFTSATFSPDLQTIFVGDKIGRLHTLDIQNYTAKKPASITCWKVEEQILGVCPWCHGGKQIERLGNRFCSTVNPKDLGEEILCPECNKPLFINSFFYNWDYPFEIPADDLAFLPSSKQTSHSKWYEKIFKKNKKTGFDSMNPSLSRRLKKNKADIVKMFEDKVGVEQTKLLRTALKKKVLVCIDDLEGAKRASTANEFKSLSALTIALRRPFLKEFYPEEIVEVEKFLPFAKSPLVFLKWARFYLKKTEKIEQIITALKKSLSLEPEHFETLIVYAELLNKPFIGDFILVKQILLQAEAVCPNSHFSWKNIGKQWEACEEYQFAINAFKKASEFADKYQKLRYWKTIAKILTEKLQQYEEAEKYFALIDNARRN